MPRAIGLPLRWKLAARPGLVFRAQAGPRGSLNVRLAASAVDNNQVKPWRTVRPFSRRSPAVHVLRRDRRPTTTRPSGVRCAPLRAFTWPRIWARSASHPVSARRRTDVSVDLADPLSNSSRFSLECPGQFAASPGGQGRNHRLHRMGRGTAGPGRGPWKFSVARRRPTSQAELTPCSPARRVGNRCSVRSSPWSWSWSPGSRR